MEFRTIAELVELVNGRSIRRSDSSRVFDCSFGCVTGRLWIVVGSWRKEAGRFESRFKMVNYDTVVK